MTDDRQSPTGWQRIALLTLRIVFGLIFFSAGTAKLVGVPMMVQEFALYASYGLGQWFRYLTGSLEIVGALLLIRPRTVTVGAGVLFCVCVGAAVAQAVVVHQDVVHAVVFAALLGWLAYSYRDAVTLRS